MARPVKQKSDSDISKPARAPRKRRLTSVPRPRTAQAESSTPERPMMTRPTLVRTKALLLAALKVWELKQGIRH